MTKKDLTSNKSNHGGTKRNQKGQIEKQNLKEGGAQATISFRTLSLSLSRKLTASLSI
jgi:hypothetical protein